MPLFKCSGCGCIENTALCRYWVNHLLLKQPALCSLCEPEIGRWHDQFTRKSAAGYKIDDCGFVYSQEDIAAGKVPAHIKIVGDA